MFQQLRYLEKLLVKHFPLLEQVSKKSFEVMKYKNKIFLIRIIIL